MRRSPLSRIFPDPIQLSYVALITCIIVLCGNAKLLLQRAGMLSSASLIGQQVSNKATAGIDSLSTFRFTGTVITSLIWGGTGLIVYSILQATRRAVRMAAYRREFDSQQYAHPQQFTHESYWRQIIIDTILGFLLLAFLIVGFILYVVVALPASFTFAQRFILRPGITTLIDPLISFVIAFIATTVLFLVLKLVIRHHRINAIDES